MCITSEVLSTTRGMWMSRGNASQTRLHASLQPYTPPAQMSSPAPTLIDVPAAPVNAGTDPAAPLRTVGSITYDREENGYRLEWETRADFESWLSHEQRALGIEIRRSKTRTSKAQQQVYLTCETFRCARNGCGGLKPYQRKTARERKIDSKRIDGGCPCYVQIKTYPDTDTILGKYNFNHSHETGKNNLKYVRIRVCTRDLIEDWVRYGVTNEEIVSDPLCDRS